MKTIILSPKNFCYWILPLLILFLLKPVQVSAQIDPASKGFQSYRIATATDTIDFYIYNPQNIKKSHLFIHIDGSYPAPLWIETDPCCATLDPFTYDLIPEDFAYVVISKHGFEFSGSENFKTPDNYWEKNTLDFRVKRVDQVIRYIEQNLFQPEKVVVVGTSQGCDVAAKLATENKSITHLGFWASGGQTSLMEFIMFVRKDAVAGKITEREAVQRIDSLLNLYKKMFNDPAPDRFWDGNSYLSYVSFSEPPLESLLQLDIPVYVAAGTLDENVAVENTYIIPVEFIRHGKTNLTFRQFPGYDHNFVDRSIAGKESDQFDRVTRDFIAWIEAN